MKKIISLVLSAVMLSATVVNAATVTTKTDFLNRLGITDVNSVNTTINQAVDADIVVKQSASSTYSDSVSIEVDNIPDFDFKATFDMEPVWEYFYEMVSKGTSWLGTYEDLKDVPISGSFTIDVYYPDKLSLPADFVAGNSEMEGFSENVKDIFEENTERTTHTVTSATKQFTAVADVKAGITCDSLKSVLEDAEKDFDTFELECTGVTVSAYGTYKVRGEVTGTIYIGDTTDPIATIQYDAVQDGTESNETLYATIKIEKEDKGDGGVISTGSSPSIQPVVTGGTVQFIVNGNSNIVSPVTGTKINYDSIEAPAVEGLTFDGWYIDPACTVKIQGNQMLNSNLVVYGRYVITDAPNVFEDGAHKLYIKGYPDGTVQPNGLITREEVTTALYRLLDDSVAAQVTTDSNSYSDVASDRWSNVEVSSMSNAGYVKGYEDGAFRPGNPITRAEFATLALRFFETTEGDYIGNPYSDISGHWAESSIIAANNRSIFSGYEDGTFRPDEYITRAEAMTVINRITVRRPTFDGFVEGHITWPDIATTDWYYNDVIEATNTHDYVRVDKLMNEAWTEVNN